jgi:hypothetical protein
VFYELLCSCLWDILDNVPGLALIFREVHVASCGIVVQDALHHPEVSHCFHIRPIKDRGGTLRLLTYRSVIKIVQPLREVFEIGDGM